MGVFKYINKNLIGFTERPVHLETALLCMDLSNIFSSGCQRSVDKENKAKYNIPIYNFLIHIEYL